MVWKTWSFTTVRPKSNHSHHGYNGKHGHLPQSDHSQIMANHGYNRPESKSERTT